DCDFSKLNLNFYDKKREQTAEIILSEKRKIKLNGVNLSSFSELNGNFYSVIFSPTHLSLIKEGPKNRRKFLDIAISQINLKYKDYISTYEKLISQRNAILKSKDTSYIEIFDEQISKIGTIITIYRNDYIKKLKSFADVYYSGISLQKEKLNIKYISSVFDEDIFSYEEKYIELYKKKLSDNIFSDIEKGSTTIGIHRDDLDILIDNISVKTYGSQGQQRSAVITLKLSEAALLKKITGENPVMLLDDVMSELDKTRQEYILNRVKDMQVFITCCDYSNIQGLEKGKIFYIKKGSLFN
ncbi:MAG: DNA replication and repair protein RecF, partial [Oscillospiraceae bacterium]